MKTILIGCLLSIGISTSNAQSLDKDLYTFEFGMNDLSIPERTKLLVDLGYKGLTLNASKKEQRDEIPKYFNTTEVISGQLAIPVIYFAFDISNYDPDASNPSWKKALKSIPKNTDLWLIFTESQSGTRKKALDFLHAITSEASVQNKNIVIYPHDKGFIESAEEALDLITSVEADNLYITVHLCHELRHGNGERMNEVLTQALPYLKYVSISGALNEIDFDAPRLSWDDAIRPLYDSEYDLLQYVSFLQQMNYSGPVFLHTFNIKEPLQKHLSGSLDRWEELVDDSAMSLGTDNIFGTHTDFVQVWPNPAKEKLQISLKNFSRPVKLIISNVLGTIISTTNLMEKSSTINIRNLPPGMYFLILESADVTHSYPVIKR